VFILTFKKLHSQLLYLAPWAALPGLAAVIVASNTVTQIELPWLLLGGSYALDATGKIFMLLAALLWSVSGVYTRSYFNQTEEQVRFYRYFLLAMAGNFILVLAQDPLSFYFGFTLMSFASYGLVVFKKNASAFRAGLIYISLVILGEVMLFAALLMATHATDTTIYSAICKNLTVDPNHDIIIILAFVGFGIKAGILGLHVWLPLAHPVAPTPASAVLSGTMIKAGILGWLRFLPLGETALTDWGTSILILGLTTAFYGVGIGLTQRDPKTILAYSSISQMGVITIFLGLGMLAPQMWPLILPGIAFYALHHGLSKGALFLGVGLCGSQHYKQRRWVWLGLWIPALALAGAPLTSGVIAKHLAKSYALYSPAPWETLLPLLLPISTVATALLMARLLYLLRPSTKPYGSTPVSGLVWPWIVLLLIIVLTPILLGYSFEHSLNEQLFASLWPLLLTLIISIAVYKIRIFRIIQPIPAGDLLLLFEPALKILQNAVKQLNSFGKNYTTIQHHTKARMNFIQTVFLTKIGQIESALIRWEFAILFLLIIITIVGYFASVKMYK
jgi:hydrogenase-4 component B